MAIARNGNPPAARRGSPLPWSSVAAPEQALHCAFRSECLSAAARRGYRAFTCLRCCDAEPSPLAELVADHAALADLAAVVVDPREPLVSWGRRSADSRRSVRVGGPRPPIVGRSRGGG